MAFEYNYIDDMQIPCNDPDLISGGLEEIYEKHKDKNILVLPMNSKMSTIGVVKSLVNNVNVQVCYAPALIYNEDNYSTPGSDCYIYKLK